MGNRLQTWTTYRCRVSRVKTKSLEDTTLILKPDAKYSMFAQKCPIILTFRALTCAPTAPFSNKKHFLVNGNNASRIIFNQLVLFLLINI